MAARPKTHTDWGTTVSHMVTGIILTFLGAGALMYGIDRVHETWISAVPTLGYWDAFVIYLMLDVTVGSLLFATRVKVMD